MRAIIGFLTSRWLITLIGAVILSALVWFYGPLLGIGENRPLEPEIPRLITIMVIIFLWGAGNLIGQVRAKKTNDKLVEDLAQSAPKAGPADAELAELNDKFSRALGQLKQRRFEGSQGKSYLYQLPWYLMIGPPGSGKTTALLQSGLHFPLGDDREVKGVGGTRNCDWFFTDEAVLIDTAGRYTTQDSDKIVDDAAWVGFLEQLRSNRKRQPINGVLVAISISDLLSRDQSMVESQAIGIRARLQELRDKLGVRFPVYVLLTKVDLIAGFDEVMGVLGEHEREQVWGMTFDYGGTTADALASFGSEFSGLLGRISGSRLDRLQSERDLDRRASIFAFEGEVAALQQPIAQFLESVFRTSTYQADIDLRGIYLTSGTQEGTPIDRLVRSMAQNFGISPNAPQTQRGNRSYFITRLLREVVFNEAGLVGQNLAIERRANWLRRGAWAAAILLLLGMGAAWFLSYTGNRDRLFAFESGLRTYTETAQPLATPSLTRADDDLRPLLTPLAALRDLPEGTAEGHQSEPIIRQLGLSRKGIMQTSANIAYDRGLANLLLPRMVLRLEDRLWSHINEPDYVIEAFKAYLMLGGQAPYDERQVALVVDELDWKPSFAGEPQTRDELLTHLGPLLEKLPNIEPKPQLDGALIERARLTIREMPLAERAYQALLDSEAAAKLDDWRPMEHAGPNGGLVLTRRSGQPLNLPIPGIYTYDGFYNTVLPHLSDAAAGVSVEGWVHGSEDTADFDESQLAKVQTDVLRLYYDDYVRHYEQLIDDITLSEPSNLRAQVEALTALSSPNSPLKLLLQSILDETRLTVPPPEPEPATEQPTVAGMAADQLLKTPVGKRFAQLAEMANPGENPAALPSDEPLGKPVEDSFAYLVPVIEGAGGAPPTLQRALDALGNLERELAQVVNSPDPDQALLQKGGLSAVSRPVATAAAALPQEIGGMLQDIAARSEGAGKGGVRRRLNAVWRGEGADFCRQATEGRYPFVRSSPVDTSLEDMSALFGAGGRMDQFINTHLAPLVDMSSRPWRWRGDYGMSNNSLVPFQQARQIRDSLFAGGSRPSANFTMTPISLDQGARNVLIDLDGQQVGYAHGPIQPASMTWPGPNGTNVVRLSFTPLAGGAPTVVTKQGTWSWFRLLHEAQFQPSNLPELYRVVFRAGSHLALFELRAASVTNPFNLRLLESFRCPTNL